MFSPRIQKMLLWALLVSLSIAVVLASPLGPSPGNTQELAQRSGASSNEAIRRELTSLNSTVRQLNQEVRSLHSQVQALQAKVQSLDLQRLR